MEFCLKDLYWKLPGVIRKICDEYATRTIKYDNNSYEFFYDILHGKTILKDKAELDVYFGTTVEYTSVVGGYTDVYRYPCQLPDFRDQNGENVARGIAFNLLKDNYFTRIIHYKDLERKPREINPDGEEYNPKISYEIKYIFENNPDKFLTTGVITPNPDNYIRNYGLEICYYGPRESEILLIQLAVFIKHKTNHILNIGISPHGSSAGWMSGDHFRIKERKEKKRKEKK